MTDLSDLIRKHAAANRLRYGKADGKAVLGKILSEVPSARADPAKVAAKVNEIVAGVNALDEQALKETACAETKQRGERIPELSLKDVPKPLVMRFAPNPNGPATLGSARGIVVNSIISKKYGGKFILRFDDTDPKTKKPLLSAYGRYLEDCAWLGCVPDEVYYASERMDGYYEHAEKTILAGGAYVCFCPQEDFKKLKDAGKACPHRDQGAQETLRLWKEMLAGKYKDGEAVLRVKTDISHKDPALRDWVAFRIIDEEHPRIGKKYVVWPMLDFESAIEDHLLGITLIIRGIDLADSESRQRYVYRYLGWDYPLTLHWGRVRIEEFGRLSTSMIRKGIEEGIYSGWDDPRLPTLTALQRRGIAPETIRKTMVALGLGVNDVSLSMETVYAENRKILDPAASRFFFVANPVNIVIKGAPETHVKIALHPGFKERGFREYDMKPGVDGTLELHIPGEDSKELAAGLNIRLMNLYNIEIEETSGDITARYMKEKKLDAKKIQWVSEGIRSELVRPEGTVDGLCEKACGNVPEGAVVQLERTGFARLDRKTKDGLVFYFGHR
ncbi:MAG: glutamate--tRNA ligase [Candidatus Altiarchaeota archaeon]|nr:glutamate--tRNA ligase [Candidatus Altiarchaeota archaeon]